MLGCAREAGAGIPGCIITASDGSSVLSSFDRPSATAAAASDVWVTEGSEQGQPPVASDGIADV